jgi:hypothetical protein
MIIIIIITMSLHYIYYIFIIHSIAITIKTPPQETYIHIAIYYNITLIIISSSICIHQVDSRVIYE